MYLTSPCNLYQDIFLLGNMPNYTPTIHAPRRVSCVVKVVNNGFNTIAHLQHQMWVSARACLIRGY